MMDRSPSIVECLRQTSKGRLQYDRHGTLPEFQKQLADLSRTMNSLTFLPPAGTSNNIQTTNGENWITRKEAKNEHPTTEICKVRKNSLIISQTDGISEKMLQEYEQARIERVQAAVAKKAADFKWRAEYEALEARKKLQKIQEENFFQLQKQQEEQLAQMTARDEELERWRASQKERLDYNTKLMMAKIKEAELTQRQIDAEIQQNHLKQQQQQAWATTIHSCQKAITQKYQVIKEALKSCCNTDLLPSSVKEDLQKQKDVANSLDKVIHAAKTCSLTQEDIQQAQQLVDFVESYASKLLQAVDAVNKEQEQQHQQEQEQQHQQQQEQEQQHQQAEAQSQPVQAANLFRLREGTGSKVDQQKGAMVTGQHASEMPSNVAGHKDISKFCASPEALKEYEVLRSFMQAHQVLYQQLRNDTSATTKKYKFDLQKAVNIPVNAISSLSGSHVRDKLNRLRKLLKGEMVEVSGTRVSAKQHPQAVALCTDLLAKKFVKQGEEQVASKFEAAFPIAATIIGLWIEFPDFGHLLLAHFHKKCPYLVPYYPPKLEGATQQEYYRSMGYLCVDNAIEKQDKFLKRMSGLMRLYAAILCSPVPPGYNRPHPHGIQNGWKWVTRVLDLEPWPDITATLLFDFLETCSYTLHNTYGYQFEKLLLVLCKEFFVKIKNVTLPGSGGPVQRLESFLQKIMQRRNIPAPEGMLSTNFWYY